jgi:hypothetical protein
MPSYELTSYAEEDLTDIMVVVAIYHERMDVLQRLRTRLKNPQEG